MVRITLGLAALLCLAGMAAAHWPARPHQTEPSRLERTCKIYTPDQWAMVPCFVLDEWRPMETRI